MALLFAIVLFLVVSTAIICYGYAIYVRPGRIYERMKTAAGPAAFGDLPSERHPISPFLRFLAYLGKQTPIGAQDTLLMRKRLLGAGFRGEHGWAVLYGIKALTAILFFVLALFLRYQLTDNPVTRMVILFGAPAAGFVLPNLVVDRLAKRRGLALRYGLPDVLDLLVVSTEAGLGLDQAIINVARELRQTHLALCEELHMVTLETLAGQSRAEALRHFADCCGDSELRKLVAILVQTDRFGTSVADALRTQSEFLRTRRRQEAEERAGKVGVKLVFPIFFFILPSMMVVVLGPALLNIAKHLLPALKQGQ